MIATLIMKAVTALAVLITVSQACKPGFTGVPGSNVCYSIPNFKVTWIDAVTMCMAQGAYLADINSFAEQSLIVGLAGAVSGLMDVWVGGNENAPITGEWRWIHSGLDYEMYDNWQAGQPDGDGNCMDLKKAWGYTWNDENCNSARHFVCKYYE